MRSVVSYRVRLARNVRKFPFPHRLNQTGKTLLRECIAAVPFEDLRATPIPDRLTAQALVEEHQISREFAQNPNLLLQNSERTLSVMVGEEDHLRIQSFCKKGNNALRAAYDLAHAYEEAVDAVTPLAYDEQWGFLTACPTNLGTGLRASALMHLPGLAEIGGIRGLYQNAAAMGLAVRGFYGEGTDGLWGYFQISNAVTMGLTEQEILESVIDIMMNIEKAEQAARETIFNRDKIGFEDTVCRSLALLRNARRISAEEAMELFSVLRCGASLGLCDIEEDVIDDLTVAIQPAVLTRSCALPHDGSVQMRDEARATFLRETLSIVN